MFNIFNREAEQAFDAGAPTAANADSVPSSSKKNATPPSQPARQPTFKPVAQSWLNSLLAYTTFFFVVFLLTVAAVREYNREMLFATRLLIVLFYAAGILYIFNSVIVSYNNVIAPAIAQGANITTKSYILGVIAMFLLVMFFLFVIMTTPMPIPIEY